MERLMFLDAAARPQVARALVAGATTVTVDPKHVREFHRVVDITALRDGLDAICEDHFQFVEVMDEDAVDVVRDALPLTRREAAQPGLWHWLTVCAVPQFVRHRWKPKGDGRPATERFLGGLNKNTLARLWWLAELTRDSKDRSLTAALLARSQDHIQLVYEHAFVKHAPAVQAFLTLTENAKFEEAREIAKLFAFAGTTVRLAALPADAIVRVIGQHVPAAEERATRRNRKSKRPKAPGRTE